MSLKLATAAALGLALLGTAAHASPNLVQNGDFTQSSYAMNNQFGTGYGGQGVTDWTGNGGYNLYFTSAAAATTISANSQYGGGHEDLYGPLPNSPTGGAFVALDGDPAVQGGISEMVTGLKVGDTYQLSFSWGAGQVQSRSGATTEQLKASLGGQSYLTNIVSNPSQSFTGWFTTTFDYTATSTSELLSFLSLGTPGGLPPIATLDGVSLVDVPEPMSFGLFGLGVASLFLLRRRAASAA